jgi:asparagine synthase (glutamine-hydrolysing)
LSGIAGVAHAGAGLLEPAHVSLDRLLAAMAHRGGVTLPSNGRPSAILREATGTGHGATWSDPSCALGIQFLPRTPEDAFDRQPLCDAESGCVLVWDGRLDNREELAAALECHAAQLPDSALVLRAFLRWREQCAARLLGDFAFAVCDARTQSLYAARDIMGVRPLFYHSSPQLFACASEVQALFTLPGVSRAPDEVMAGEALLWWSAFSPVERTFFRDVRRLPPAHWLCWSAQGLRVERYWDIDPCRQIRYRRQQEYLDEYADLLRRSVACRLRSARPIGIFLSGGMDSSALASVAGQLAPEPSAHAFHMQLVDDANDESPLAELVARQANLPFHAVPLHGENVLGELEPNLQLHQTPLADLAFLNDLTLLHRAAQRGCGAIFTGDGSDEVFSFPWAFVADLVRGGRWLRLARTLGPYARYFGRTPLYFLKNSMRYAVPRAALQIWKRGKWNAPPPWIAPDFSRRSCLLERLRALPAPRKFPSISAQEDYVTLTRGRRVITDERRELEAARLGLEYRFPFYDRRMLEFMFAVPWEEKVDGWLVKPFLRKAPGLLPPELQRARRKANYTQYEARLQRSQNWNSLRPLFDSPPTDAAAFVHLPEARRIAGQFLDLGDRSQQLTFLNLTVFLLWLKTSQA